MRPGRRSLVPLKSVDSGRSPEQDRTARGQRTVVFWLVIICAGLVALSLAPVVTAAHATVGATPTGLEEADRLVDPDRLAATDKDGNGTDITVTVEGQVSDGNTVVGAADLSDGDRVYVAGDQQYTFGVESNSTVDLISVRIDGKTRRSYVPNATTFSDTTVLDLGPGPKELRVVVDTANRTTSFSATIVNDPNGPLVTFESPFSAGFTGDDGNYSSPKDNYTIGESRVSLDAQLHDAVGVDRVVVERTYSIPYAGETIFNRSRYRLDDPGESISQPLHLGRFDPEINEGVNELEVVVFDKFEQSTRYSVTLRVNDTDDPEISVSSVRPKVEQQAVELAFSVSDRVGLRDVGYRYGSDPTNGSRNLLFGRPPLKQPVQRTFEQTIPVSRGAQDVILVARDGAGHETTLTETVDYDRLVTPRISFTPSETGVVSGRTVRVSGRVFDGQIVRVHVETVSPDGEVLDIVAVHGGGVTESVDVDERLEVGVYPATARIRAVDVTGTEHVESFQLSQDEPIESSEPSGTPEGTPTSTGATPAGETDNSTAPDQESAPESGTDEGVLVRNATLSESTVTVGEAVFVNATLANRADGNTVYVAGLSINGTVRATESVTLPAGANRSVSFRYTPNETGTYAVAVNGTSAGELTVGGGGLLASVLGVFDPVFGLLGSVLGVLPLGLLKPLVLFVVVPVLVVLALLKGLAMYLGY